MQFALEEDLVLKFNFEYIDTPQDLLLLTGIIFNPSMDK